MSDTTGYWAYYLERMDNRQWPDLESCWCVDAGLTYPQNTPNAILQVTSAAGTPTLQQPTLVYGGANYSTSTYATISDPTGFGAQPTVVVVGGVVVGVAVAGNLVGYTDPVFTVVDPTGAGGGAAANIEVLYATMAVASASVFTGAPGFGAHGDIIRMGDRKLEVLNYISGTTLNCAVLQDHQNTIPDDPFLTPIPLASGDWTIAAPITTVYGLGHLEGMLVSILADGIIVEPMIVVNGSITLPNPATKITIGLGFTAQLQTLYLDIPGGPTVQGRRKEFDQIAVRLDASGSPFEIGTDQPDASTQPNMVTVPWTNMADVQLSVAGALDTPPSGPLQPFDLFSGDCFPTVFDQLGTSNGQIAIQQTLPIPINVLATICNVRIQDDASP